MNDNAIILTVESVRTRASTSEAIISFALPLENATQVSKFMGMIGEQVGAAFVPVGQTIPQDSSYGKLAKTLRISAFFRTPKVWHEVGTDEEFLEWLRGQACCVCLDYDYIDDGRKVSEAAHVRRVADGAGTGIKPPYSAVPMCHKDHLKQHQNGEQSIGTKEWWREKRMKYVQQWAWETLKEKLGYEHWSELPPEVLVAWAHEHDVYDYLPRDYKRGE